MADPDVTKFMDRADVKEILGKMPGCDLYELAYRALRAQGSDKSDLEKLKRRAEQARKVAEEIERVNSSPDPSVSPVARVAFRMKAMRKKGAAAELEGVASDFQRLPAVLRAWADYVRADDHGQIFAEADGRLVNRAQRARALGREPRPLLPPVAITLIPEAGRGDLPKFSTDCELQLMRYVRGKSGKPHFKEVASLLLLAAGGNAASIEVEDENSSSPLSRKVDALKQLEKKS